MKIDRILEFFESLLYKRKWYFFGFMFVYIFGVSLIYFQLTNQKETSYVHSIFAEGYDFIVPLGHEFEFGDSDAYNKLAYSLIERGDFYNPVNQKSAWVTPGYPLFLALIYKIFGYSFLAVFVIQALFLVFAFFLATKISYRIYGREVSFGVFILLIINFRFIAYCSQVYTEVLFIFVLSAIVYILLSLLKDCHKPLRNSIILGGLIGFGILVRPVLFPYLLLVPFFLILYRVNRKYWAIVFIISISFPSVWLVRNYSLYDRLLVSTNSEITMSSGYLNIDSFNFFEPYSLQNFAEKNTPNDTQEFLDTLNVLKKELLGEGAQKSYPQGYIFEPVSHVFVNRYSDHKIKKPLHYLLRTAYLFKVLVSPRILDMSTLNTIISSLLWAVTFLPYFISLFFFRRIKYIWLLSLLGFSLFAAPALNIVDSNLRYQLPTQFIITIVSAVFIVEVLLKNNALNKFLKKFR